MNDLFMRRDGIIQIVNKSSEINEASFNTKRQLIKLDNVASSFV